MLPEEIDIELEQPWISNGIRYTIYVVGTGIICASATAWALVPFLINNQHSASARVLNNANFMGIAGVALVAGGVVTAHDEPLRRTQRERRRKAFLRQQALQEVVSNQLQQQRAMQVLAEPTYPTPAIANTSPHPPSLTPGAVPPALPEAPTTPVLPEPLTQNPDSTFADRVAVAIATRLADFNTHLSYRGAIIGFSTAILEFEPINGTRAKAAAQQREEMLLTITAFPGLEKAPLPNVEYANGAIAVEIPRPDREFPLWSDFLTIGPAENTEPLIIPVGVNVYRQLITANLTEDPNVAQWLIGGTTGGGKTGFSQQLLASLVLRYSPQRVQIIIVDPKQVDFSGVWQHLAHLAHPVINEVEEAISIMEALCDEMNRRYENVLKPAGCPHLGAYNVKFPHAPLPEIVMFLDEIREFTEVGTDEQKARFANAGAQLAGKARAAGIHLICCTQYPRADVIPMRIKSNCPARVGLLTATNIESNVIVDAPGCENLMGRGDLLYRSSGKIQRLQSLYLPSDYLEVAAKQLGIILSSPPQSTLILKKQKTRSFPQPPATQDSQQMVNWFKGVVESELTPNSFKFSPEECEEILNWISAQKYPVHAEDLCEEFLKLTPNTACLFFEKAEQRGWGKREGIPPNQTFIPSPPNRQLGSYPPYPSYPPPDTTDTKGIRPKALPHKEDTNSGYESPVSKFFPGTPEIDLWKRILDTDTGDTPASELIKYGLRCTKPSGHKRSYSEVGIPTFIYLLRKYGTAAMIERFRSLIDGTISFSS